MKQTKITFKHLLIIMAVYIVVFVGITLVAYPQIAYKEYNKKTEDLGGVIGGIYEGRVVSQPFTFTGNYIQKIYLMSATYNRKNNGKLSITLKNSSNEDLWSTNISSSKVKNDAQLKLQVNAKVHSQDGQYILEVSGIGNGADDAATLYVSNDFSFEQSMMDSDGVSDAVLYMDVQGRRFEGINYVYIFIAIGGFLALLLYGVYVVKSDSKKGNLISKVYADYRKYHFLIKQLVSRDFKTKYKRSVLGALWSFLNPILTMAVQYVVFSTIFRSGIENFPVYLLSASILFNFFTESVGNGLGSITGNVSLITKVSIPRYIYPVSRVLSSGINLLMSTIPLLLVVIITGCPINKAYLFVPIIYILLLIFCVGLSMLLATSMVFFRDTLFLWGIVSLLWMYATPIFYPESIIPARFSIIFKANPIYYYLKCFRSVLMDGVAPEMYLLGIAALWSVLMLVVGVVIFSRNEKKFTLYI